MVDNVLTSVTQSLALNAYQFCILEDVNQGSEWFEKLENEFSSLKLSGFVRSLGEAIGAKILNLSSTDYEPFGASAALLIGQQLEVEPRGDEVLAHLDASHIAAHTYFESSDRYAQFRLEIEVSSCGGLSPIALIDDILNECKADFAQIDYRVRGIRWTKEGSPELARETNELAALSIPGYDSVVLPSASQQSIYLELVRQNPEAELRDLLLGLRSKPSK